MAKVIDNLPRQLMGFDVSNGSYAVIYPFLSNIYRDLSKQPHRLPPHPSALRLVSVTVLHFICGPHARDTKIKGSRYSIRKTNA